MKMGNIISLAGALLLSLSLIGASCESKPAEVYRCTVISVEQWRSVQGNIYLTLGIEFEDRAGALIHTMGTFTWESREARLFGHVGAEGCLTPQIRGLRLTQCSD
jgi:prephenate dehydratase